jgi:hypothetical protein
VLIGLVHVSLWFRRKLFPHEISAEAAIGGVATLSARDRAFLDREACRTTRAAADSTD